jgi:acyl carrier protein
MMDRWAMRTVQSVRSFCVCRSVELDTKKEVLAVIDEVLSLRGRTASFTASTPLLGALPELDSMAVIGVVGLLEERFGFSVGDDEIDGETFATVGSLVEFVNGKLA